MNYPDLKIELLRAMVAVADAGSFTAASGQVGRSQSAISQKILRLEETLGRRLFERNSRSLRLTPEGEQLLAAARQMIDLNEETVRRVMRPPASGTLRLGISEEFIPARLPRLLSRFVRLYPDLHLELKTGLSCDMIAAHDAGALDMVIAKREAGAQRGRVIWREPLRWMAAQDFSPDTSRPLPLVLLRPPCTYRQWMLETLDAAHQPWVVACTASSLMGVQSAVAGGLGVTLLGQSFLREGLVRWQTPAGWPAPSVTEITLIGEDAVHPGLAESLVSYLAQSLRGAMEAELAPTTVPVPVQAAETAAHAA